MKALGIQPTLRGSAELTPTVILLVINSHVANLHRNHGYSIICISLSIILTNASPLSPPIKRGIKAGSISAVTYIVAM